MCHVAAGELDVAPTSRNGGLLGRTKDQQYLALFFLCFRITSSSSSPFTTRKASQRALKATTHSARGLTDSDPLQRSTRSNEPSPSHEEQTINDKRKGTRKDVRRQIARGACS
jgi:hypothetical protein